MHQEIYEKLKEVARKENSIIYYSEIAPLARLNMENPPGRVRIGQLLDEINRYEASQGRPMLSAVVIAKDTNQPGEGFFTLAKELRRYCESDLDFWIHEIGRVRDYWRNH